MAPLRFEPILKSIIWGGHRIAKIKEVDSQDTIGESWEIADIEGNVSRILNTKNAGMSIHEWIAEHKGKAVGEKVYIKYGDHFPLLIKLIDAQDDLSIQVHPNDTVAAARHNSKGKTEMWYVMDADADATLVAGLNKELTREELSEAIEQNTVFEHLAIHPVKKGNVYFLPAGRVHAIRKGTMIAEIQQSSTITYRIFDYNRVDKNGCPRQMHVEESKDVITLEKIEKAHVDYSDVLNGAVTVVNCDYFTTNMVLLENGKSVSRNLASEDSFVVYMVVDGGGIVASNGGEVVVKRGDTVLVPADEAESIVLSASAADCFRVLEAYV